MRFSKTVFKQLLICICFLLFVSMAIAQQIPPQKGMSPGSTRQREPEGVRNSKGDRRAKSAYQQELEVQRPKIIAAIKASGRPLPKTAAEAQALGAELTSEGYKRLADNILLEMLSLRVAMAESADEQFCAAIWTGSYAWDMVAAPILYLPDQRQRNFAQITAAAQLAEIQNRPSKRSPPDEAEVQATLERLFKGLRTDDASFLLAAFKTPLDLAATEQCKATRLYYRGLKQMAPKDSLIIFRLSLY